MELVVLSGKGGTGKTTIATALSELANDVIRVDCDVDVANFHLFYKGKDIRKEDFIGGQKAYIDSKLCINCGQCAGVCRFGAIENFQIDPFACEGCGACTFICPKGAINLEDDKAAEAYITDVKGEIISRADMEIGSDGSGKLISLLRKNAKEFSNESKITIVDGSPGIGCSVISSITGSNAVLVVTEPTKSGLEDLKRVVLLCEHFGILTMVCINKFDINEKIACEIENLIKDQGLEIVGKIPYDDIVMRSINELKPITNYKESKANKAINKMWINIKNIIF
ncbi:ATP-binding protein [Clostridium sp. KNHs214]|uniref:ATP-binding protein n=1 Tax=Clostridium sp. KNHs214 TaxID=1540257 RepID=UPI000554B648|nr:ATP-binding protein [Clostridium sp. KNHs214]